MKAERKIKKAKIQLNKHSATLNYLVMRLNPKESEQASTMGVLPDGTLLFNRDFVDDKDLSDMMFLLSHEVLHLALKHHARTGNRNKKKANVAQDYAVNSIIRKNGMSVPDEALYERKYGDWSFEKIYADLPEELRDSPDGSNGGDGDGDNPLQDPGGNVTVDGKNVGKQIDQHPTKPKNTKEQEEMEENLDRWGDRLAEAVQAAKSQGDTPAGFGRLIEDINSSKLSWRELLQEFVSKKLETDYTFKRPRRTYYYTGTYLPSAKNEGQEVIVAIDSSGSIGSKELEDFAGEIDSILSSYPHVEIELLIGDARLQDHKTLKTGDSVLDKLDKAEGGGGTSHEWVFEWIEENNPSAKCLVCFTDGYTTFPDNPDAGIDTLWVSTRLKPDEYPFGRTVEYERD